MALLYAFVLLFEFRDSERSNKAERKAYSDAAITDVLLLSHCGDLGFPTVIIKDFHGELSDSCPARHTGMKWSINTSEFYRVNMRHTVTQLGPDSAPVPQCHPPTQQPPDLPHGCLRRAQCFSLPQKHSSYIELILSSVCSKDLYLICCWFMLMLIH